MTREGPRLPRALTVVYGLVVVTAFGSWFYGYGVLIDPIVADTGWSESWLATAYGVGLLGVGLGSVAAGRALDRIGPRPVFALAAAGGAFGTIATVTASGPLVFVAAAVLTQCCVGAVGYYTIVHAAIAHLAPQDRTRAITVNTLWGAFASPVFLPLVAGLNSLGGWRTAIGVGTGLAVAALATAAVASPRGTGTVAPGEQRSLVADLRHAVTDPVLRRLMLLALLGGMAFSVLILYQVPAMVTAGLALGTASLLAGLRGIFQLAGRLPLPWLVARMGSRRFFQVVLALVGLSGLLLPFSGTLAVALAFAAVAGFAVGGYSTMESIYASELVPAGSIGMVLGSYSLVRGVGSAIGPVAAGAVIDLTGSRVPVLVAIAVVGVSAALVVPRAPHPVD
ncbi:MFS transporter [Nocardioides panacisoli]|uniref:MFS transporter n=1 Tax=Nocardioides panacisoli TaxID=627624 RepID=UPI001C632446|nr:MFS transporter [Nocardioides panacisoli]QYJ04842.1 MFS transporter [Nocardioides panacisoli]